MLSDREEDSPDSDSENESRGSEEDPPVHGSRGLKPDNSTEFQQTEGRAERKLRHEGTKAKDRRLPSRTPSVTNGFGQCVC
jgi:hypothetical protein